MTYNIHKHRANVVDAIVAGDEPTAHIYNDQRCACEHCRARMIDTMTREQMLALCQWNDRHGCWTEEQCELEGIPPATDAELRAILRAWLVQS